MYGLPTVYEPTVGFRFYRIAYILGNHCDASDFSWQKLSSSLFSIDIVSEAFIANMLDKHMCIWEGSGCLHSETFLVISRLKHVLFTFCSVINSHLSSQSAFINNGHKYAVYHTFDCPLKRGWNVGTISARCPLHVFHNPLHPPFRSNVSNSPSRCSLFQVSMFCQTGFVTFSQPSSSPSPVSSGPLSATSPCIFPSLTP